jgi:hypothetical protein
LGILAASTYCWNRVELFKESGQVTRCKNGLVFEVNFNAPVIRGLGDSIALLLQDFSDSTENKHLTISFVANDFSGSSCFLSDSRRPNQKYCIDSNGDRDWIQNGSTTAGEVVRGIELPKFFTALNDLYGPDGGILLRAEGPITFYRSGTYECSSEITLIEYDLWQISMVLGHGPCFDKPLLRIGSNSNELTTSIDPSNRVEAERYVTSYLQYEKLDHLWPKVQAVYEMWRTIRDNGRYVIKTSSEDTEVSVSGYVVGLYNTL